MQTTNKQKTVALFEQALQKVERVTERIELAQVLDLVTGKTEKVGGVDPATWFDVTPGVECRIGHIPIDLIRANEHGDRYDGTVNLERAKAYQERDPSSAPPVVCVLSPRSGEVNILDGGHRITAARLRGDDSIFAIVRIRRPQIAAELSISEARPRARIC